MKTVLVTPTWLPEIEHCEMLMDSAAAHVSGFDKHLLLVDAMDEAQFRHLARPGVEIIVKQDLLPAWLRQLPFARRWWLSSRGLPVRGWILQQVTKLAVTQYTDADACCYVDSDTVFVRDFAASDLWSQDRVRFYRDTRKPHFYASRRYRNWYGFAARQFRLGDPDQLKGAYIAQFNTLHRAHASAMLEAIEQRWQRPWMETLLHSMDFSEFVLYGAFVDACTDQQYHYATDRQLCHSSWLYSLNSTADLERFVGSCAAQHVALHVQSNLGLPVAALRKIIDAGR
jgi:hypothetical protein